MEPTALAIAIATTCIVGLGTIGGLVVSVLNYKTANRAALFAMQGREAAVETRQVALDTQTNVQKVELATNSMKDALVKATAEASHAEGMTAGRAEKVDEVAATAVTDRIARLEQMMQQILDRLPEKKGK